MIKDKRADSMCNVPRLGEIRAKLYLDAWIVTFLSQVSKQGYSPDRGM